jgi:hypothetical protein
VVLLQAFDAPLHPTGDAAEEIDVDGGWTGSVAARFVPWTSGPVRVYALVKIHAIGHDAGKAAAALA